MSYELVPMDVIEGELIDDHACELGYSRVCTNADVQLVEDPYAADVDNNSGQLIWTCDPCLGQLCDDT